MQAITTFYGTAKSLEAWRAVILSTLGERDCSEIAGGSFNCELSDADRDALMKEHWTSPATTGATNTQGRRLNWNACISFALAKRSAR